MTPVGKANEGGRWVVSVLKGGLVTVALMGPPARTLRLPRQVGPEALRALLYGIGAGTFLCFPICLWLSHSSCQSVILL